MYPTSIINKVDRIQFTEKPWKYNQLNYEEVKTFKIPKNNLVFKFDTLYSILQLKDSIVYQKQFKTNKCKYKQQSNIKLPIRL